MKLSYFFILFIPIRIFAEVMDKEMSLSDVWTSSVICCIAAYFCARRHPILFLPILLVALCFSPIGEINDEYVGPGILQEAGQSYIVQAYLALFLVVVSGAYGAIGWSNMKQKLAKVNR